MAGIVLLSLVVMSMSVSATPSTVSAVGAPNVVSTNGTNLNLFVMGSDGNLYIKNATDGSVWGTSASIGGANVGITAPSAIAASGNMTVFARGSNGGIYSTTSAATNWTGNTWTTYGGGGLLKAGTGPSAVNATTVFVTGTNGALYQGTLNTKSAINVKSGNFAWLKLGGTLTSSPGAVVTPTGVTVFVGGTNGVLYSITNAAGKWGPWTKIGGQLLAGTSPSAYSWSNGRIGLFVAGTNGALYGLSWQGNTIQGWQNLGGILTSSPGATAKSVGDIDVFATGGTNAFTGTSTIYQRTYTSGAPNYGWGDWTAIGGL